MCAFSGLQEFHQGVELNKHCSLYQYCILTHERTNNENSCMFAQSGGFTDWTMYRVCRKQEYLVWSPKLQRYPNFDTSTRVQVSLPTVVIYVDLSTFTRPSTTFGLLCCVARRLVQICIHLQYAIRSRTFVSIVSTLKQSNLPLPKSALLVQSMVNKSRVLKLTL